MIKFKSFIEDSSVRYHLDNNIPLGELYRVGSEAYYETFREARRLAKEGVIELSGLDKCIIEDSDIGEFAVYEGENVPLDSPMMESEYQGKDVELNVPKAGGPKKYYVYVKNDKGNVVKVTFGLPGARVKIDDPARRKSFAARHRCDQQKDKTSAVYWACRLPYFAKQVGLSGGGNFFW